MGWVKSVVLGVRNFGRITGSRGPAGRKKAGASVNTEFGRKNLCTVALQQEISELNVTDGVARVMHPLDDTYADDAADAMSGGIISLPRF